MDGPAQRAWTASLGAWPEPGGTAFRVWAPGQPAVEVLIERPQGNEPHALMPNADGTWSTRLPGVAAGDRYWYRLAHDRVLPDPASRYQPAGVHGPSGVVDPRRFAWTDGRWSGPDRDHLVLYELHVGTFSPEGTFAGAAARLPELAALGVTAIELMPVADFPGDRNWGYDGVALFAPARCYGTPDDLRRLIDVAHGLGLGVVLDVVYNHLGPDGAYLSAFSADYFTERHHTPWGAGLNFDGAGSERVREFFIENALHWVHEYHVDGLRLDATHAIADAGPRHILAELAARVRESAPSRQVLMMAEDHRNLRAIVSAESEGGWGLDGVWADDFHHQCRRLLAGDSDGYFGDFTGRTSDLAATIRDGWFYQGQFSAHLRQPRGTDPAGLAAARFVICLQNHDQVGNRALGERLHHQIDLAAYRAASALLLLAPETPLLFMGQEWAAGTPFRYFTDHHEELGRLVTEGRRGEFRHFAAFADPAGRQRIPDPQAVETFESSRLRWEERGVEPHALVLRLYQALLALRRSEPALGAGAAWQVAALDEGTIGLRRGGAAGLLVIVRLTGGGDVDFEPIATGVPRGRWRVVLSTEDPDFAVDPSPPEIGAGPGTTTIRFLRPGALIVTAAPAAGSA